MDFKCAFDYISRHALLFKLISQGFNGKLFQLLRSLFSKAISSVKWNSELGELFRNTYGVRQGGVISPSLFKLYIEDMQEYFGDVTGVDVGGTRVSHLLQADDLVLMSETRTGLQSLFNRLELYCRRWHLILNVVKTKTMIFNEKYEIVKGVGSFTFENKCVNQVNSYKYLGVMISSSGNRYSEHYTYLKEKPSRAIIAANIWYQTSCQGALARESI